MCRPLNILERQTLCNALLFGILGSPVTPPALGAGELAGSNPAIPTKKSQRNTQVGEGDGLLNR